MRQILMGGLAIAAVTMPAAARESVSLASAVYVEKTASSNGSQPERLIEPAARLVRGDKVVLMVEWQAQGSGKGFAITSPIPRALAFQNVSMDDAEVSVDGGKSWGKLGQLHLHDADGLRLAAPEDVTDLRWRVSERDAERGRGRITYSAIVR